jgi:hypothetical protein
MDTRTGIRPYLRRLRGFWICSVPNGQRISRLRLAIALPFLRPFAILAAKKNWLKPAPRSALKAHWENRGVRPYPPAEAGGKEETAQAV